MASTLPSLAAYSNYKDRYFKGSEESYREHMAKSTVLYVGNLSFYTTEEQIYELFSKAGDIKRIIMGLDRNQKTPCGFCFVEFYRRQDALDCMKYVNGTKLDDRPIRTDIDPGFLDGRQYGRGRHGGQVRDEHRKDYDEGRGGYGFRMRGKAYDDFEAPHGSGEAEYRAGGDGGARRGGKRRQDEGEQGGNRGGKRTRD